MRKEEIKNAIDELVRLNVLAPFGEKEASDSGVIIDGNAYFVKKQENDENQEEIRLAIIQLLKDRLSFFAPVPYEYQEWCKAILDAIYSVAGEQGLIYGNMKDEVVKKVINVGGHMHHSLGGGGDVSFGGTIDQIIGAYNSYVLLTSSLYKTLDEVSKSKADTLSILISDKHEDVLINRNYISSVLDNFDIVGLEDENCIKILDKDRILTKEALNEKQKRQKSYQCFNSVVNCLSARDDERSKVLFNGTTAEIIDFFSKDELFGSLLKLNSGVWEGFTIKQHTESVMRWFDINYKHYLPEDMAAYMKLVFLLHDIGKGKAYREGRPQKEYNIQEADRILSAMQFSEEFKEVTLFLIGASQRYTSLYYIHKNYDAKEEFEVQARKIAKKHLKDSADAAYVLWDLASVLQNCDSGSYTLKGITRNNDGSYYFNGNGSWGRSFNNFVGYENTLKGGRLAEPEQ